MIVKMSRVTILCTASAREETLTALQGLGVLHVQHLRLPGGEKLEEARVRLQHVRRALEVLPPAGTGAASGRSAEEVVEAIWAILRQRKTDEERLEDLQREKTRLQPFGSFDPGAIQQLEEQGIVIRLFQAQRGREPKLPDDAVRVVVSEDKHTVYFAVVARGDIPVDAAELRLPEKSLAEIERELREVEDRLAESARKLAEFSSEREAVAHIVARAEERVEFLEAREGMLAGGPVAALQGFCPEGKLDSLRSAAAAHGWGLVVRDPDPDDRVPTLLRISWWSRPIQVLYDVLGILPGYDEVDISPVFLVFFSIFFGMLIGDAGYGLLFLAVTLALRRKMSPALFGLLTITSGATVLWGAVTGTWFAAARLPAPLAGMKIGWLMDNNNLMELCFLIGTVHLTIAHGWRAWILRRSWQSLAHVGWVCCTWGMFFLARYLILQRAFPPAAAGVLGAGVVAIVLFMTPVAKLKTEWFGHAMLPLNVISNFGDVVSYVRLFAVGSATLAVGAAFNEMLLGLIKGPISGLVAATILFAGHALNIGMAILSVMVHGVRLNALEFSQHMDITWKGFPYRPFARRAKDEAEHTGTLDLEAKATVE